MYALMWITHINVCMCVCVCLYNYTRVLGYDTKVVSQQIYFKHNVLVEDLFKVCLSVCVSVSVSVCVCVRVCVICVWLYIYVEYVWHRLQLTRSTQGQHTRDCNYFVSTKCFLYCSLMLTPHCMFTMLCLKFILSASCRKLEIYCT